MWKLAFVKQYLINYTDEMMKKSLYLINKRTLSHYYDFHYYKLYRIYLCACLHVSVYVYRNSCTHNITTLLLCCHINQREFILVVENHQLKLLAKCIMIYLNIWYYYFIENLVIPFFWPEIKLRKTIYIKHHSLSCIFSLLSLFSLDNHLTYFKIFVILVLGSSKRKYIRNARIMMSGRGIRNMPQGDI